MRVDLIKRRMATSAAARVFWLTLVVATGWVAMVYLTRREVTVPDGYVAMVQDKKPWYKALFSKKPENVQFLTGPKTVPVRSEVQVTAARRSVSFSAELVVEEKRLIRKNHWYHFTTSGSIRVEQQALEAGLTDQKLKDTIWKAVGEDGKLWEHRDNLSARVAMCIGDEFRNQGVSVSLEKVSGLQELQTERKPGLDLKFEQELFRTLEVEIPSWKQFFPTATIPLGILFVSFLGSLGFLGPVFYGLAYIIPCLASRPVRRTVRKDPAYKSSGDALGAVADGLTSWLWWPPLPQPEDASMLGDLANLLPGDRCCDGAGALDADCCPGDAGCIGDCDPGGCDCGGCDC